MRLGNDKMNPFHLCRFFSLQFLFFESYWTVLISGFIYRRFCLIRRIEDFYLIYERQFLFSIICRISYCTVRFTQTSLIYKININFSFPFDVLQQSVHTRSCFLHFVNAMANISTLQTMSYTVFSYFN